MANGIVAFFGSFDWLCYLPICDEVMTGRESGDLKREGPYHLCRQHRAGSPQSRARIIFGPHRGRASD